jgi:hypothetical protein
MTLLDSGAEPVASEPAEPASGGNGPTPTDVEDSAAAANAAEPSGEPADQQEPEPVEVDWNGRKYKVHPDLRDGVMLKADYTRKTTEVATERKAVAAEREAFVAERQQHAAQQQEFVKEIGQLTVYDDALAQYAKVDWNALRQQNPQQAQAAFMDWQQLKANRDTVFGALQQKVQQRTQAAQQDLAKRAAATVAHARTNIPGFRDEAFAEVSAWATERGISNAFIEQNLSPLLFEVLYKAHAFDGLQKKADAARKAPAATGTTMAPLDKVGARSGGQRSLADLARSDDVAGYAKMRAAQRK